MPLNTRLLAILLGCVLTLGIVVFFVHWLQIRHQAGFYLDEARKAKKEADQQDDFDEKFVQLRKASANYRKYCGLVPGQNDVLAEHGLMLSDSAEAFLKADRLDDALALHGSGLGLLEKVLREEPNRQGLRRTVLKSLQTLGRAESSLDHIALLAKAPPDRKGLRDLFDRYDLWQRAAAFGGLDKADSREKILDQFFSTETKSVDRSRVLAWLQDNDSLWMVLEDPELLTIYGKCQIMLNRPSLAEKPIAKALSKSPDDLENYRLLAGLLHKLERASDADYWMSEAVSVNPDSHAALQARGEYRVDSARHVRKANALALAREAYSDATESVLKAMEQAIDKVDAAVPPVDAGDLKAAFDEAMEAKPRADGKPTPRFRDRLIAAAKAIETLRVGLPGIRSEAEGVRDGLVLAARCELAMARVDEKEAESSHLSDALAYGTATAELFPGHAPAYLVLAEAEQESGHEEKAIEWLRKGSSDEETGPVVLWQLGNLLIHAGRLEEASQTVEEMNRRRTPEIFRTHLEGMTAYSEGKWLTAKERFERVLPHLEDWPQIALQVNLLIADCCDKLKLVDQQRQALWRAAALDLTSADVLMNLANLEMQSDQLDEAIEDYHQVLRLKNAPPVAYLALAHAVLTKNLRLPSAERNWLDVDTAVANAERALPNSPRVAILQAELLTAKGKPEEATKLFVAIRDHLRKSAAEFREQHQQARKEAEGLAGDAQKKKREEADRLLYQAADYEQLQGTVWQSLIHLAERQKNWEGAAQLIETAEQESGDSPRMRLVKAQNMLRREGAAAAPRVKELLENTEDFTPAQRLWLWRNFAAIAYEIRDYSTAQTLCNRVLEAEPNNLGVERLQFQIAAARGDVTAMESRLDRIKRLEDKPSAFWYYGEALRLLMLVEKGGSAELLQRALDYLNQARQMRPKWGQISLLAGMIHERAGRGDAAIDEYLEAIDLGAMEPNMVRRTAQLLIRNNRLREADRMFRMLTEREPLLSDEMNREKRLVKAKLGDYDAALQSARKIAATSDKFEDHVWLGQLLGVVARNLRRDEREKEAEPLLTEAEEAFRQAVILKSDSPEPWVALIQFFAQTDQKPKAEKMIAQARLKLSPAVAATAMGQCYEVLNEPEKATLQYEAALADAPEDPVVAQSAATFYHRINQPEKAKAQLTRIIGGRVKADKPQRMAARRHLAMVLSEQGGRSHRDEAVAWIEKNLAESPDSPTDQYLKAVILADDLSGKNNQKAIAALEQLVAQRGSDPQIQFKLAQLYLADGNWREYKLRMERLLKTHGDVPQYVAAHAIALVENNDYHEAEIRAMELTKLAPDAPQTVALRSELAFQQGQYERVKNLLREHLESPSAKALEKEERLAAVANVLENFASKLRAEREKKWADVFSKDAHDAYRRYIDLKPGRDLLMASFLAKQEKLDEAIELIDAIWETHSPDDVARACFDVIDGKGASAKQLNRVDEILRKTALRHPDAVVLQIVVAIIRSQQERFDDAESIYREILRKSPDNPTALNNLAVLLARHGVKLNEARTMIDRAIAKAGPNDDLLDSRAIVELALNRPESALEDLRKAILRNPTPIRYFHQAEAFQASGQRKAAIEALKRSIRMGLREEHLQGAEQRQFKKLQLLLLK
ncbi:MAG TPA: tetratricopeptide repeat protein [Thermoguttaceae bacterium]|nr:tetratricopeptide repeat protein [Thermoguttaceae bacterium]